MNMENTMTQFGNPISIHQFVKSHADNPEASGIFYIGHGRWMPRCEAGVLLIKSIAPYTCIKDALADLASVGYSSNGD